MQYADVAEWQNELLESDESQPGIRFWRRLDVAAGAALEIPFQNPAGDTFAPILRTLELPPVLVEGARAVASRLGVGTDRLLLTVWCALLSRLARQADVLVGLGLDGRRYEELAGALGLLQRHVPLAVRLEAGASLEDAIGVVSARSEEAEKWQECFDREHLDLEPGAGPGFAFAFEYLPDPGPIRAPGGGPVFEIAARSARVDRAGCRLTCEEGGGGLRLALEHDGSFLGAATAERLAGQFQALLSDAIERPREPIAALDVLSEAERHALLVEFNDTRTDYPRELCAHHWIEEQARKTPDAVAVQMEDRRLTYGELDRRANQLAHHLVARGVGPDSLVALCIERSVDMVTAIVGILKAGGAYVPVDPAYPADRLAFLLEDTRAPVLVTERKLADRVPDTGATRVVIDAEREEIERHPSDAPESGVRPDNLVYVIYTSGSTGRPKGVVITHRKLVISNSARVSAFGHTPEKFLLLSSFAFDSSVVGIFWTLCAGGTLLLIPEGLQKDIGRIPGIIGREGVSHLLTLPSFYQHLLEQSSSGDLGGMRAAIVAGEACPLGMVDKHRGLLDGVGLYSEYGATETTVFSSVYDCLGQTLPIAPVGSPIDNAEMYVLDERLAPCPIGVPGEVHFGGEALALGYWRRPSLTAERFVPHPFSRDAGARLYKSGDLARHLENGDVEFLGRLDNQVKIRGFRIELEEIEIALALHPAVKESAVLALTDLSAEKRLVALRGARVAREAAGSRRATRVPRREPAGLHGAGRLRVPGRLPPHAQRQGGPQGAARAGPRAPRARERVRRGRLPHRAAPGRDLGRRPRPRRSRRERQLLRAGRRLDPQHPDRGAGQEGRHRSHRSQRLREPDRRLPRRGRAGERADSGRRARLAAGRAGRADGRRAAHPGAALVLRAGPARAEPLEHARAAARPATRQARGPGPRPRGGARPARRAPAAAVAQRLELVAAHGRPGGCGRRAGRGGGPEPAPEPGRDRARGRDRGTRREAPALPGPGARAADPHGLVEGRAQRLHQAIALRQEIAQPGLQRLLLAPHLGHFGTVGLEALVGTAQAALELRTAGLQRFAAVLGAGDAGEHLHQRGVALLALALEHAQRLHRLARLALGIGQACGRCGRAGLHRLQLVLCALELGLCGRQDLLAQLGAFLRLGDGRLREVRALALLVADAALELLDPTAQLEQRLAAAG